ncbi:DNA polymerase III subunit delta [Pseudovibrio exalbescens]|uniref:DNA polymerase III subunit delta n=1 Tax=Pseudovibrio exalbescens TaxID=197461 RepID=A0A1U7JIT4_9HYPH|nr:DNA polymerase III subunit delta [Pseudovibrio exalbescens]OKL44604.1 DNA polymerase III subunit delta [Pseudovibrio exalbescens]
MVALKAQEVDRFVAKPPESVSLVLVYGPDTGLVSERAATLIKHAGGDDPDPFSQIKLDGSDISSDPNRLVDEALTISMFGGRRTIWVKDGSSKNIVPAVETLLRNPDQPSFVVIEAGDLKKTAPLRKKIEGDKLAVALPCFPDTAKDVDRLIDEETKAAGLMISREARMALHALLGADRRASRGELQKLCLYAMEDQRIESHHVEEIIGDASAFAMDELIDAAALGQLKTLDQGLERFEAGGMDAGVIASQALRHFQQLHFCKLETQKRRSADDVVGSLRPPVFWKRKSKMVRQVEIWPVEQLERALIRLNETVKTARLNAVLGPSILSHALLMIGQYASRLNR